MTRIINGFAQPDIVATRRGEKIIEFIESPASLFNNIEYLYTSLMEIQRNEPNTEVRIRLCEE